MTVERNDRAHATILGSKTTLRTQHIDRRQVVGRGLDGVDLGADTVGQFAEDTDYLAALGILQLSQLVVQFDHLDRLDKYGFTCCRFALHKAIQLAFVARRNGYHSTTVAD